MPRPSLSGGEPVPVLPHAIIGIPLRLPLTELRSIIDSVLPERGSLAQAECSALGGVLCHQYAYIRDDLAVAMSGDRLTISALLSYRARLEIPLVGQVASCGFGRDRMPRARITLSTTVGWRPDWRIGTDSTALAVRLIDECRVTALGIDASPFVRRLLEGQLDAVERAVDAEVPRRLSLKQAAESLWTTLQTPAAIGDSIWLTISPATLRLAPITSDEGAITSQVALTARPTVSIGARPSPDSAPVQPLPPLAIAASVPDILSVPVRVEIPFTEVSARINAAVRGRPLDGGHRIAGVGVWGAGDSVVVQLDVAGDHTLSLYLVGAVVYDAAPRTIGVSGLRYTIESDQAMTRIGARLAAGEIRSAIQDAVGPGEWPVGPYLESVRAQLGEALGGELAPGVTSVAEIYAVDILGVYSSATAFVVHGFFAGRARIELS